MTRTGEAIEEGEKGERGRSAEDIASGTVQLTFAACVCPPPPLSLPLDLDPPTFES